MQVGVLLQHSLAEMRTLGAQVLHQFTVVQVGDPSICSSPRRLIIAGFLLITAFLLV